MMQRTIEFYPAVNPMDPKKHHQQQEKNKPNKQTTHNLLNPLTKTFSLRETFAKELTAA